MWFWMLYRAKQDGPVLLGWRYVCALSIAPSIANFSIKTSLGGTWSWCTSRGSKRALDETSRQRRQPEHRTYLRIPCSFSSVSCHSSTTPQSSQEQAATQRIVKIKLMGVRESERVRKLLATKYHSNSSVSSFNRPRVRAGALVFLTS